MGIWSKAGAELFQAQDQIDRHEKRCGHAVTDRGNFDGLWKFYACSTEFFYYTLFKVKIL